MAREVLSATISAPVAGVGVRSTSPTRGFEPGTGSLTKAEAKAMQAGFRGRLSNTEIISAAPDEARVAITGHSGLFSLKAFVGLRRPAAPQGPVPGANPAPPNVAPAPINAGPADGQHVQQAPAPMRLLRDRVTDALNKSDAAQSDVERVTASAGKTSVAAHAGIMSTISSTLAELRAIETETIRAGLNDPNLQQLHAAQKRCVAQMIELLRPELAPGLRSVHVLSAAYRDGMLESLCNLDSVLQETARRGGDTGYSTARLIGLITRQAGLAALPSLPDQTRFQTSAGRMAEIAESVLTSVTPPRDGAALNSLIGINAELDGVLKLARRDAIEALMAERVADRSGLTGPSDLSQPQRAEITRKAREVVEADAALATLKQQLQAALRRAGADGAVSINGLGGLRVDAALVTGLRQAFGADAKLIGLTLAALFTAQRAALDNASSRDLRADMQATLVHLRAGQDTLAWQLAALPSNDPQRAALQAARGEAAAAISYFENRVRGLSSELENAAEDVRSARGSVREIEQQRDRLVADISSAATTMTRASLAVADLERAKGTAAEDSAQLDASLSARATVKQAIDVLETELATIEGADDKPGRLQMARNALDAAKARHEAMMLGELVTATRAGLVNAENQRGAAPDAHQAVSAATESVGRVEAELTQNRYGPAQLTGGLTDEELGAMGLSAAERRAALEAASQFARQGLSTAEQVRDAVTSVNTMIASFSRKSGFVNAAVDRQTEVIRAARDDQKPRLVADALVRNLTGDPDLDAGVARQTLDTRIGAALSATVQQIGNLSGVVDGALSVANQDYARSERELLRCADGLADLQTQRLTAQAAVRNFDPSRDLDRPEGLRAAKHLMGAVGLLASIRTRTATPEQVAEFDRHRDALRGFDQTRMRVPFWQFGAARTTVEDIERLANNADLMGAASAIIFLRETEAENRGSLHRDIETASAGLDQARAVRGTALGAEHARAIRDAVRLAVLDTMRDLGQTTTSFTPSEHGDAIRARLTAWQLPVDALNPEIDAVLSDTFGPMEFEHWRQSEPLGTTPPPPPSAALGHKTRDALMGAIDQMQAGTRVKVNEGGGVQLQSGNIPVAPATTFNAKVAVGQLGAVDIARAGDGYELVLRRGWETKAGAEAGYGISGVPFVKLQAFGGLEGAGARLAGISLKFSNNADGREALKAVLEKLFSGQDLSARELGGASQILPVLESRYGGKLYGGAKATAGFASESFAGNAVTATVGGGAAIQASIGQNVVVQAFENTNLRVFKKDRETVAELSGVARLQYGVGLSGSGISTSAMTDAVGLQAATSVSIKTRVNDVYGSDGLLRPATTRQKQVHPPRGALHWAAIEAAGGERFTAALKRLNEAKREDIRKLSAAAGGNDLVSITYTLDPAAMDRANGYLMQASGLRERGGTRAEREKAAELEKQAQAILDDDDNFRPSRFQLIATQDTMATINAMNLVFVQVSAYVEDKGEWVAADVTLT